MKRVEEYFLIHFIMKTFFLILSLFGVSLIVLSLTYNDVNAQGPKSLTEDHHTCRGTSGLGGSCSATCTDKQNCTCNTGFFACNCFCDSPVAGSQITAEPGPIENWETVKDILSREQNATAVELSREILDVYYIAKKDVNEYVRRATVLDQKFNTLPSSIQLKVINALPKL